MDGSALNPGKTGFLICNITVCLLTVNLSLSYRKMGGLQREKEEKEKFIHPLAIFHNYFTCTSKKYTVSARSIQ
jgi:hypothetical protein